MASRSQLDQLVAYFASGNKAEFARILGISKQGLNSWYTHEYIDVGKVLYACRDVSIDWLFTGEGEMLIEKRPPVVSKNDKLIPFIHEDGLCLGKWDDIGSFILVRGDQMIDFDFITRLPNGDLAKYIAPGSLLGCKIVNVGDFTSNLLYILRTKNQGLYFVMYEREEKKTGSSLYKFSTIRDYQELDIQLALPPGDIIQCASIDHYSVNYFNDIIL